MLNVSGIPVIVRNAGTAITVSDHSISVTCDSIVDPTRISAGAVPAAATAPALILVGSTMLSHVTEIEWSDTVIAVPAFLTITGIPLTFSIANGLALGFTTYTLLRVLKGEFRKINWF